MAGLAAGSQTADEFGRLVEQRDVGVAESVNRLFTVAHDENRRWNGVRGGTEPFAPTPYELRDELPLCATRVLKFVHEDVVVAGLEAVAAAGELVHLFQQVHGTLEEPGEVDQRAGVEGARVFRQGDRKHPPNPARQDDVQVAPEGAERLGHEWSDRRSRFPVPLPIDGRRAVARIEGSALETLRAWLAFLRQKIGANAIDERARQSRAPPQVGQAGEWPCGDDAVDRCRT